MLQLRTAAQHRCNNALNLAKSLIGKKKQFSINTLMGLNPAKSLMCGAASRGGRYQPFRNAPAAGADKYKQGLTRGGV